VTIEQEEFDAAGAELHLALPSGQLEAVRRQLADLSRGQIRLVAL